MPPLLTTNEVHGWRFVPLDTTTPTMSEVAIFCPEGGYFIEWAASIFEDCVHYEKKLPKTSSVLKF